jgi:hypothetical protein
MTREPTEIRGIESIPVKQFSAIHVVSFGRTRCFRTIKHVSEASSFTSVKMRR